MRSLTAALPANIEFVYVNAPSLATGDFGWWHEGFDGWERTRDWAIDLMCAGPRFDGIFGFSQGAALAAAQAHHPLRSRHRPQRRDRARKDSLRLAGRFVDPLIVEHPGGHIVPAGDAVAGPIAAFLAAHRGASHE
jgi:hypothetical protein